MASHENLDTLNDNDMVHLSSFLTHHDIFNLILTNKSFAKLLSNNYVWKLQISNYIPLDLVHLDEDFPSKSPKDQFHQVITKLNEIRDLLANIILKVQPEYKAQSFLNNNFLNDLKTRQEIDEIISQHYHKIPLEYYLLFRLLNGQSCLGDKFNQEVALFGSYTYYDYIFTYFFQPLAKPVQLAQYQFHNFTTCEIHGTRTFVDFNNVLQQGVGAIVLFKEQRKEYGKAVLSTYVYKPNLLRLLQDLNHCQYNSEEEVLDHFDSWNRPCSDITTNGIRVRTAVVYSPWDRRGNLFAYQIRVSANGVQGHWKLTKRHWIINDNGVPDEVIGDGVIGLYPEVYEGCPEFTYQSCTPMRAWHGSMKGFLHFRNRATGEIVKATVGEMKMELPEGTAILDFYPESGEVKLIARG